MKFQSNCNCNRLHLHVIDPNSVTRMRKSCDKVVEYTANQAIFNPKRICEHTIGMRFSFKTNLGTILLCYL